LCVGPTVDLVPIAAGVAVASTRQEEEVGIEHDPDRHDPDRGQARALLLVFRLHRILSALVVRVPADR
jgi:hypothetical protein